MAIFFRKFTQVFVGILSVIVQVANLFLGNIIVFEATEGITFNWVGLLHSKLFWGVLIFLVIYYSIPLILKQQDRIVDEQLEQAISNNSVELIKIATESAKEKDFESSKKALKVLDRLQKRRRR